MSRCTATSKRSKQQCLKWAVQGKTTCHMHGGRSSGPKTIEGKDRSRLAVLKHGGYTKTAQKENQKIRDFIRESQNRLHSFGF